MVSGRYLSLVLLIGLAGCQFPGEAPETRSATTGERLRGTLQQANGHWQLIPCGETHAQDLDFAGALSPPLTQQPLYADLLVESGGATRRVQDTYRIGPTPLCSDRNYSHLRVEALGHDPQWRVSVVEEGLVLSLPGQPELALPYLEEDLPDGGWSFSTAANGQQLDLWISPQECHDTSTGSVQSLSAQLSLNGRTQRGCAYYGGAHRTP